MYIRIAFYIVPVAPSSVVVSDVIYDQFDGDIDAVLIFPVSIVTTDKLSREFLLAIMFLLFNYTQVTSPCFFEQNITVISKVLSLTYSAIITKTDNNTEVVVTISGLPVDQFIINLQLTLLNDIGNATLTDIAISKCNSPRVNTDKNWPLRNDKQSPCSLNYDS